MSTYLDEAARLSAWSASKEAAVMRANVTNAACEWLAARKPPGMSDGRFLATLGGAAPDINRPCDVLLARSVSLYLIAAFRARAAVMINPEEP